MNLPPLPLINGCLFVDNSGWVEGMSTCYRLLQRRSLNQRISVGEKIGLNFGSAIHLALELRYARYGNKSVDQDYYDDIAVILTEHFAQHPPPADDWRTLNWAMETVRRYIDRYDQEDFQLLKYEEPIDCPHCHGGAGARMELNGKAVDGVCLWCHGTGKRSWIVELPFAIPLYTHQLGHVTMNSGGNIVNEIPVIYTGKIDLPVVYGGMLFTMDHKTTSYLGDMFWNEQRISSQHRGYCWALQQVQPLPVKGYVVNGVRSKDPPDYVLKGIPFKGKKKTPAEWWQESLVRDRMMLQPGELELWKRNTIDLCEEFFWHYSRDYMPTKTKWCAQYGKCQYYDLCRLLPEDQESFLARGLFTDNTWSPLIQPTQAKQ